MDLPNSVVAGRKPVKELLNEGLADVDCVFVKRDLDQATVREFQRLCDAKSITLKRVPQDKLKRLAEGANHQGVIALISPVALEELHDVLSRVAPTRDDVLERKPLLVMPAEISDPHNLGAIVRSSVGFGAEAILLPDRGTARISPTVIKSSAGMALRIPFARIGNIRQTFNILKERGYWIVGLTGDGETKLAEMDWDRPIVVVVGSESSGLSRHVELECDYRVSIPIADGVESLNASVATGIALHAAGRCQ